MWYKECLPLNYEKRMVTLIPTTTLFCTRVNPQDCSKILASCSKDNFLSHYPWLKRIRRNTDGTLSILVPQTFVNVEPIAVPEFAPISKEQAADMSSNIWPVYYKQPTWRPIRFNNEEKVKTHIKVVFGVMSMTDNSVSTTGSKTATTGDSIATATIDDSVTSTTTTTATCATYCIIQASGKTIVDHHSNPSQHPLHHAVMLTLDKLACLVKDLERIETSTAKLAQHPSARERFGKRGIITTTKGNEPNEPSPLPLYADWMFIESNDKAIKVDSTQYYAKDLTVYVNREPCVMCSMALVHSRIACVLWTDDNPDYGGFTPTDLRLNAQPKLNHSFRALGIDKSILKL